MKRLVVFLVLLVFSCGHIPFTKKTQETEKGMKETKKEEKVVEKEPKPGDIKVIDGVEYIYARNRRYMVAPHEPEYVWIRKDQYSPSLGEILSGYFGDKKQSEELTKRIARLEEELKKKSLAPQLVYPTQIGSLPYVSVSSLVSPSFSFPAPKMRRRVIVLPFEDKSHYKEENIADLVTKRIISKLENSGVIICVAPETINLKENDLRNLKQIKVLNETYNIQALIKGELVDLYTSTSKLEGKEEKETSFAISRIFIEIYDTETGNLLKKLSGRNPVFLARETGDMSSEKAKIKAIDISIEIISEDLLKTILSLDWHARIASLEGEKIYINAGRLSGLEKGDVLEVYAPGQEIIDTKTKLPLGRTKGQYKGEIEIVEFFGVDAAVAKVKDGKVFSTSDLVFLKK